MEHSNRRNSSYEGAPDHALAHAAWSQTVLKWPGLCWIQGVLHARDLLPERLCGWGFQALVLFFGRVVSRHAEGFGLFTFFSSIQFSEFKRNMEWT